MSVALVIEREKLMHRIIASSVACTAQPYSSSLSSKRYDFMKSAAELKTCFDIFYKILSEAKE